MRKIVRFTGVCCANCAAKLERALEKIDGINSRISELKSEIEQLDSVQFKTTQQEVRLSNLGAETNSSCNPTKLALSVL